MNNYYLLTREFYANPRNVLTVPLGNKKGKWFYVFVEKGKLYVENGHNETYSCKVKKRLLNENELEEILDIYRRRKTGEPVSQEATKCTRSQVYWYGIFNEMNW